MLRWFGPFEVDVNSMTWFLYRHGIRTEKMCHHFKSFLFFKWRQENGKFWDNGNLHMFKNQVAMYKTIQVMDLVYQLCYIGYVAGVFVHCGVANLCCVFPCFSLSLRKKNRMRRNPVEWIPWKWGTLSPKLKYLGGSDEFLQGRTIFAWHFIGT